MFFHFCKPLTKIKFKNILFRGNEITSSFNEVWNWGSFFFFFSLHSLQSMKLSFLPFLKDIKSNKMLWLLWVSPGPQPNWKVLTGEQHWQLVSIRQCHESGSGERKGPGTRTRSGQSRLCCLKGITQPLWVSVSASVKWSRSSLTDS